MRPKVALITGAGRRLGAEIARRMAKRGFTVIAHANASRDQASRVVTDIEQSGGKAVLLLGDLTLQAERERMLREIDDIDSSIDVLINNASFFEYDFPGTARYDLLTQSMNIHIAVPFLMIEHFAKRASRQRRLDVFNILDQKLDNFNPDYYSYTVGKAGLYAISKCWQGAANADVRVFGLLPGSMYPSGRQTEAEFILASRANLLERAPAPDDVCEAILFFCDHPAIPAQNVPVDAGERLTDRRRDPAFDRRFTVRD